MAYEYDPRRRRRGRVPPQLRAWVFGRRRRRVRARRYDPEGRRVRRYRVRRRYDPERRRWIRRRVPTLRGILPKLAGFGAFFEEITSVERRYFAKELAAADLAGKFKILMDSMCSRIIGYAPFGTIHPPRVLNPMGIFNKWLGAGIGMYVVSFIPRLPYRGLIRSFGKWVGIGGALGGLFHYSPGQPALQTAAYNPALAGAGTPLIPQREKGSVWA